MRFARTLLAMAVAVSFARAGTFVEEEGMFLRYTGKPFTDSLLFDVYNPDVPFVLRIHNGPEPYNILRHALRAAQGRRRSPARHYSGGNTWSRGASARLHADSIYAILILC